MKYFGTDGIRELFSESLVEKVYKVGYSFSKSFDVILVAKDTRESGEKLALAFISGAVAGGATTVYAGILSTPALSFAVRNGYYKGGAMITASHNPSEYNGIKLFDGEGYKLCEGELNLIEEDLDRIPLGRFFFLPPISDRPKELYLDFLRNLSKPETPLSVLIDCANGATADIAKKAFSTEYFSPTFIGTEGIINENCGVFYVEKARDIKKQMGLDLAFIFDGDGDRIVVVDEENEILDGDIILYILAKWLFESDKLKRRKVVGTVYSSIGLEKSLKNLEIDFERTKVGDRFIAEVLRREFLPLGGESSGHIIYNQTTGDGVRIALFLSWLSSIKPLSKRKAGYIYSKRKTFDIDYNDSLYSRLTNLEKEFNSNHTDSRILVRKSGTEPKIRILIESENEKELEEGVDLLQIV